MSEVNGVESQEQDHYVNLALDPNLLNLPLYNSSSSPSGAALEGAQSQEQPPAASVTDVKRSVLIENPYEIFGQMPMNQFIPLVLQQRGPGSTFADLSEEDLKREIEAESRADDNHDNLLQPDQQRPKNDPMDVEYPGDDQNSEGTPLTAANFNSESQTENGDNEEGLPSTVVKPHLEELAIQEFSKIKREMVDNVNLALNESSLALEFVSLLLSSVRESAATSSLSPYLKKTVPIASLNSDRIPYVEPDQKQLQSILVLNKGWKLNSLDESRTLLKETHTVLSETLQREHDYWKKLSKYINNKDVIFKMRDKTTNQRILGIKYGYEDSGSTFKHDKGIAGLKSNIETRKLELIPTGQGDINTDSQNNEKFIRVRIFTKIESEDDSVLSGESFVDDVFLDCQKNEHPENIRVQISRLKAFIFEKELMYRMKKECSSLISYGVTVEHENKLVWELPNEKVEVEFLSLHDTSVVNHDQDAPKINDKRASLILITMRMLLIVLFKKELRKRLVSPNIASRSIKTDKDVLLIRPILGKIRHHNYKTLLKKVLKDFFLDPIKGSTFTEASEFEKPEEDVKVSNEVLTDIHIRKIDEDLKAFDCFLEIPISKFEILLPNKSRLMVTLKSPNYCNAVVIIKFIDDKNATIFNTQFSEFREIEEFLNFIVSEYEKEQELK